ncbi:MAG TPA: sulfatase [Verrucomicrobiales bacterium]|nr:sulfatase [Verrucomicrobiales bacterium]|tara:strand:+ start:448 stop:1899 length:1452 start_codon:yes stop_codon:yes gene_type:complete
MIPTFNSDNLLDRRRFLNLGARGMGALGLASLTQPDLLHAAVGRGGGALGNPHFRPKAKRVIYLFFSGGPSHIDMYDFKPGIRKIHGIELPDSIRQGQRITGMTSGQKSFPCVAPMFEFKQHGQSGAYFSEILPNIASIADEMTLIRSVNTEAINHDPAITYINTGTQQLGHPSMGAWLNYGLGSPTDNLPGYIVMISKGRGGSQALYSRLWGSGFLPSKYQGVKFRSSGEPVLFLNNPPGIDRDSRRAILDSIRDVNAAKFSETRDAEIQTRIAQYEMAFRMQASVPELTDLKSEPEHVYELYGKDAKSPGKFAYNCILARRMLESGVPFVQLFHRGWDQHGNCPRDVRYQCEDVDQPAAALVKDLKQRGMLDDTLVICGGEFGRTIYSQGKLTKDNHGRDHHGRCFSMWMAGGGIRKGHLYGETDDFCYNIVRDPVHINDLNATALHCLGLDHEQFTYRYQGLDQRLTSVQGASVINEILA